MQEEYVSSNEGVKLLGTTRSKFFYHVEKQEIGVLPGETVRKNRYNVQDILSLKERLRAKRQGHKKPATYIIDWSYASDIPAGLALAQALYGEEVDIAGVATYESWRRNNNRISMAAFSLDRKECYAALQVLPLDESLIIDVLSGRRMESSITPDEIRSYEGTGAYTLLATNVICLPSRPGLLYGLLSRYMDFWIEQYPDRYVTKLYAQAVSEQGNMLAQHFFMLPRWDIRYDAYELEIARPSASKIVRNFQARLKEKAPLPPALQWPPAHLTTPAGPAHIPTEDTVRYAAATARQRAGPGDTLTGDLVGVHQFSRLHGDPVNATSIDKAIKSEALKVTKLDPPLKHGQALVQKALNREQQEAFVQRYQSYAKFHRCGRPSCPCSVE